MSSVVKHVNSQLARRLLKLAREAIAHQLGRGEAPQLTPEQWPDELWIPGACFVSLTSPKGLRGCIGNIEAQGPLLESIRENALGAAFRDPRFPPLAAPELDQISISISLLGTAEELHFQSCRALASQLVPERDGAIIEALGRKAVFLPQVWEVLPEPEEFIYQLKRKAMLPESTEPPQLRAWRFNVQYIEEEPA